MTWRQALRRGEVSENNEKAEKAEKAERPKRPTRSETPERVEETGGSEGPVLAAGSRPRLPVHPAVRALAMVIAFVGTVLFGAVLARLTLEPSAASAALVHSNVRPGHSISAYLDGTSTIEAVRQLGGNLLMGVPFGVLLPVLLPPARGLLRVAVVTVALMTLVELTQGALVTGRVFDIDDVILNTSGALLGYLFIGLRLGRAVHPRRRHWWHR
ncbi:MULTISPECIES: VanZ family protein [unclassified Streptomyces]|uniref:VanZ family protein n=2 Tax=Streptomyces TaxID=1883 RepID=UPI001F35C6E1|nr:MULTISPECIES: VanZ family protein [unclassified Streptomyces]